MTLRVLFGFFLWGLSLASACDLVWNPVTSQLDCSGTGGGGGTIGGSLATGQICYGASSNTCAGSAGLTFSDASNIRLATLAGGSSQSTNALLDVTNSAGTGHHLTVLGDGKVGIGTNAPTSALQVTGVINASSTIQAGGNLAVGNLIIDVAGATPYLNFATSGKLFVIGRTTGVAQITTLNTGPTGIGPSNTTPANATLSILDATPASGATATWVGHDGSGTYSGVHLSALATTLKVVAGLTQGATKLVDIQDSAGVSMAYVRGDGLVFFSELAALANGAGANNNGWQLGSDKTLAWSLNGTYYGTKDTSLSRCTSTAGCVAVGTGAAGSTAGTLRAQLIQAALSTVTFSATPTFDLSLGNTVKITFTANVTSSTWSNQRAGQETTIVICQNGTGGYTFAFPSATLGAFTIGATASKCSTQKFVSDGTNLIAQGVGTIDI